MYDEKSTITYRPGDKLSFTIAPDDKVQQFLKAQRVPEFYDYYKTKFDKLDTKHYSYWFRIEVSEPIGEIKSEGPRLHLHGILHLKTRYAVFNFLIQFMPDILQHALIKVNHLTEETTPGWINYCNKQSDIVPSNFWLSNEVDNAHGRSFIV